MATGILIVGQSGTGKSTSLKDLDPSKTVIVNVVNKPLPFPGWKAKYTKYHKENNPTGNMFSTDKASEIQGIMKHISEKRPDITAIVIDDAQYIMANEYMRRADEAGYKKFSDIGQGMFNMVTAIKDLREDLTVVMTMHADVNTDALGNKQIQAKTIGKMFDQYVTLEGLFSIVLYTQVKKADKGLTYQFVTQNSGVNSGKSPLGMFSDLEIPNDLETVIDRVHAYNEGL